MYQNQYDREKSRQRSRDRQKKHHNKSPSEDSSEYRRHKHTPREIKDTKPRTKRVKFDENFDIKVFRKEDEPSAKGLGEQQIVKIKAEIEKEIAKSYDFNWQHYKHRDAVLQSNSMKEQKQREKALNEKLMSVKQQIVYFSPVPIRNAQTIIEMGVDSFQKSCHTTRIHDILGCYYTHLSQIPNQPQFQIINTNTTQECKLIKFDNDTFSNDLSFGNNTKKNNDNQKPIKGILKMPNHLPRERTQSEPRTINPNLIYLLKDIKLNPSMYNKQKTEQLLKPYKESGQLEYLTKNKQVLEMMLKNSPGPLPTATTTNPKPNFTPSVSTGRESLERQNNYQNQPQQHQSAHMGYGHTFVPKADKYRTVPCKYYHGPQGCNKIDNCTYIHDQRYPGVTVPVTQPHMNQNQQNQGQQMPKMQMNYHQPQTQPQPQGMYAHPYPPSNMGPGPGPSSMNPNMPNSMGHPGHPAPHPGYMMPNPMPYPNPAYYNPNNPPPNSFAGGAGYPPHHYMGGQYNTGYPPNAGYGYYQNNGQGGQNPQKQ